MNAPLAAPELDRLFAALRPKLHRFCARMTGSVIDGEDVVQVALMKAVEALPRTGSIAHPEAWLFRIAHNAALDFIRGRARKEDVFSEIDPDSVDDPVDPIEDRQDVALGLRRLMQLPAAQRSAVILMDVLGYSLQEVGNVTDFSIPAIKASLHRGRARLRELAQEPDDIALPALAEPERSLLAAYVERFNARDFDAVRDMLADEVRLELVNKTRINGRREVSKYFTNYSMAHDWQFVPGFVDRRPAALVRRPDDLAGPVYFVVLEWAGDAVVTIRDFRHAPYATEGAELIVLG
jgi:RNA polymerase sigma-70 factor, ECF subfamily